MPYTHPDLGVTCMTTAEFWKAEADRENLDVISLMENHYQELREEEKREANLLLQDKEQAFKLLHDYYSVDNEDGFMPLQVLEMLDAKVEIGSRSSTSAFQAKVKCTNGVRVLEYIETSYVGSYMEPPDFDCQCQDITDTFRSL